MPAGSMTPARATLTPATGPQARTAAPRATATRVARRRARRAVVGALLLGAGLGPSIVVGLASPAQAQAPVASQAQAPVALQAQAPVAPQARAQAPAQAEAPAAPQAQAPAEPEPEAAHAGAAPADGEGSLPSAVTGRAERRFAGPPADIVAVPGAVWVRAVPMTGRLFLHTPLGEIEGTSTGAEWQLIVPTLFPSVLFYEERHYDLGPLGHCESSAIGEQPPIEDPRAAFRETVHCGERTLELEVTDDQAIRLDGFLAGWAQVVVGVLR